MHSLDPLEILHVKNLYGLLSALLPASAAKAALSIEKWIDLAEVGKMLLSRFQEWPWSKSMRCSSRLSRRRPLRGQRLSLELPFEAEFLIGALACPAALLLLFSEEELSKIVWQVDLW